MKGVRLSRTGAWLALAAAVASGCTVSPMPEPPLMRLEAGRLLAAGVTGPGQPTIRGEPGAAVPAGALVRATNLDNEEDPAEAVVAEDGSFGLDLLVDEGDEVRLQLVGPEGRSEPLDVVMGPPLTTPSIAPRPLAWCFLLEPEVELSLGAGRVVRVDNRCDEDLVVEAPALRRPVEGIEVGAGEGWPVTVPPLGGVDVRVEVEEGAEAEEIFFVTAVAPERDRRPVTVLPP